MSFQTFSHQIYDETSAVFISFFAGDIYYHQCGEALAKRFNEFQTNHLICLFETEDNFDWPQLCKQKIFFIKHAMELLQRPVIWVDVDTHIENNPRELLDIKGPDLGCFLRNFHYLPTFNSMNFSRLIHPGYVYYGHTPRTLGFIDEMVDVATACSEAVTDDWVVHEALRDDRHQLSFYLFSPAILSKGIDSIGKETIFVHGDSGSVQEYKGKVKQHDQQVISAKLKVKVLSELTSQSMVANELSAALLMCKLTLELDPDNDTAQLRLLRILRKKGDNKNLKKHLEIGKKNPALQLSTFLFDYERCVKFQTWTDAERVYEDAIESGSRETIDILRSRRAVAELDWRAKEYNITDDKRVKMWWWQRPYPGNWGDIINPYIIEKLTGIPPKFMSNKSGLLAVGSIITWATDQSTIWGSGSPRIDAELNPNSTYRAVRGPLTRKLVLDSGADCPEVYGDPALLLPLLYLPKSQGSTKKNTLGLVLHHNHNIEILNVASDIKLIDIHRLGNAEIEKFIDEINECEAIISTSLHGVIVAHSYGIPARWCTMSDMNAGKVPGDMMKYHDYLMSVQLTDQNEPLDLCKIEKIDGSLAAQTGQIPNENHLNSMRKALLRAAPFELIPSLLSKLRV